MIMNLGIFYMSVGMQTWHEARKGCQMWPAYVIDIKVQHFFFWLHKIRSRLH